MVDATIIGSFVIDGNKIFHHATLALTPVILGGGKDFVVRTAIDALCKANNIKDKPSKLFISVPRSAHFAVGMLVQWEKLDNGEFCFDITPSSSFS